MWTDDRHDNTVYRNNSLNGGRDISTRNKHDAPTRPKLIDK